MPVRTDMKHFTPKVSKFDGIYRGVVEDNKDPEMLGRCRIRIWGIHDELKDETNEEGIPTELLPWGEPCLGLVEGSVSGYGMFSIPVQGSHVFCFFEGGNWESLRYFATAPGQPSEAPDPSLGFNDPDGNYPREDRLDEPDIHRLARGVTEGTIVEHKNNNLDLGIEKSTGETWDEPESAYAAQYPNNLVLTTHGGITVEIDSTEGAERVHVFHPTNTYIEIDAAGNIVFKNEGDRFEITKGDRNKHIMGSDNETVDIDKTKHVKADETVLVGNDRTETVNNNETIDIGVNRTETVGADEVIDIGNDRKETVGNDEFVDIGNNRTETVGNDETLTVTNNRTETIGGNQSIDVTGSDTETVGGTRDTTVGGAVTENLNSTRDTTTGSDDNLNVGGSWTVTVAGDITLAAGGAVKITGTRIDLN